MAAFDRCLDHCRVHTTTSHSQLKRISVVLPLVDYRSLVIWYRRGGFPLGYWFLSHFYIQNFERFRATRHVLYLHSETMGGPHFSRAIERAKNRRKKAFAGVRQHYVACDSFKIIQTSWVLKRHQLFLALTRTSLMYNTNVVQPYYETTESRS